MSKLENGERAHFFSFLPTYLKIFKEIADLLFLDMEGTLALGLEEDCSEGTLGLFIFQVSNWPDILCPSGVEAIIV